MVGKSAIIALLGLFLSNASFGCTCVQHQADVACTRLKTAGRIVFIGTLVAADNAPDERGSLGGTARYKFDVNENFSGAPDKTIEVFSGTGCCDCSVRFTLGKTYLVDTSLNAHASICSDTRPIEDATALVAELRAIRNGKTAASVFGTLTKTQELWGGIRDPNYDTKLGGYSITFTSPAGSHSTVSAADGTYRLTDLPEGTYSVAVSDLPPTLQLSHRVYRGPLRPVRVAKDACGEINLDAMPTGSIEGHVIFAGGNNAKEVTGDVVLYRPDKYPEHDQTFESAGKSVWVKNGAFRFDRLVAGDYVVLFRYFPTYQGRQTFYPSGDDVAQAAKIHVGDGEHVKGIQYSIKP